MKKGAVLKPFLIFTVLTAAVCVLITLHAGASGDGEKIFRAKCGGCHSHELALGKTYDKKKWTATAKRMKSFGLDISSSEAEAVADYLASRGK
jgi:mono/diheme cytochrome c family protein